MRAAVDGGLGSRRCEQVADTLIAMSSINVRARVLMKLRRVSRCDCLICQLFTYFLSIFKGTFQGLRESNSFFESKSILERDLSFSSFGACCRIFFSISGAESTLCPRDCPSHDDVVRHRNLASEDDDLWHSNELDTVLTYCPCRSGRICDAVKEAARRSIPS